MPCWKRTCVLVSMSLNRIGAWATIGSLSWNLFAHIHHKNEGAFYKIKNYLWESVLQRPMMLRQIFIVWQKITPGMKRKRSGISGQEVFSEVWRKHNPFLRFIQRNLYASNNSTHAERLANPNSPFVTNRKFLSELIKSYESSEPLIQATNTCKVSNHLSFSRTSGSSLWASDFIKLASPTPRCIVQKHRVPLSYRSEMPKRDMQVTQKTGTHVSRDNWYRSQRPCKWHKNSS